VIASQVIGNTEVVQQGKTGFLVDLQKTEQFQQTLLSVLTNREKAKELGEAGRNWVVKEFSWASVAKEYVQLFDEKNNKPFKTYVLIGKGVSYEHNNNF
jgi:starch synthase